MIEQAFKILRGVLEERSHRERARICAHVVAPTLLLGLAIAGSNGHWLVFDLVGPITISQLNSELSTGGEMKARQGVALVIEPTEAELRIPVDAQIGKMWTSLDEASLKANRDHLSFSSGGIVSRTPLIGVSSPVTLIIEGKLGSEVQVPGGANSIDGWQLPSRRSLSILSSVLFACVFALGMALATTVPTLRPNQKT